MEVKKWTYEEFPDYTETPEGASRICTTGDEIYIRYIKDVEFACVDGVSLKLQILKPETRNEPDKKYPCLVYVQGSAWKEQDLYMTLCPLCGIAKLGYVVAVAQYRHSGQAVFPAQVQDAKNAVRFMRANAGRFCADPSRIAVGGDSSGGHTAVFCALVKDGDDMDRNMFPGVSAEIMGVLDYYGTVTLLMEDGFPTTTSHHTPRSPEGKLLGGVYVMEHRELAEAATAATHITPETVLPPVCIFHGTKDRTANVMQSVELYQKLKACGKDAELYLIEGADHGGAGFWTDEACAAADRFLRRCQEAAEKRKKPAETSV